MFRRPGLRGHVRLRVWLTQNSSENICHQTTKRRFENSTRLVFVYDRTMADQLKWSDAFDALKMEKGEHPIHLFSRVDRIVGILSSFGAVTSVGDVNRKLRRNSALSCTTETLLPELKSRLESIMRQRHLDLPTLKKNVGSVLMTNGHGGNSRGGNRYKV